jgi:hypothetical protein
MILPQLSLQSSDVQWIREHQRDFAPHTFEPPTVEH